MFKRRVNGASRDRVYRASSACVACPDGSPLLYPSISRLEDDNIVQQAVYYYLCCVADQEALMDHVLFNDEFKWMSTAHWLEILYT